MPRRYPSLVAAMLLALVAGAAQACPKHSAQTAAVVTPEASPSAVLAWKSRPWSPVVPSTRQAPGLVISIDPVDGAMGMPAPGELSNGLVVGDDAPVTIFRRDNGSRFAVLDERFAEFTVATLGPDGRPSWTCVHGPLGAEQFMKKPVVAPAAAKPATIAAPAPGTVWEVK